ncbi:hypothetical protein [Sphingobacterium multivorum]|uniref:hypothetical protein n=1 Tax=Sphingobacterium multivorum TaxID=28454 RepID=UPI00345EA0E2
MQIASFSPSVNIIRDKDREISYVRTINGQLTFEQIVQSAQSSIRSFSIIGAYGTGKSTFLWALERAVLHGGAYFDHFDYFIKGYSQYKILDLVGEFISLQEAFSKELKCEVDQVFDALQKQASKLKDKQIGLIIRIDEFGKFLEYAAKNNPEKDFYFLQQLTEYINNDKGNVILITTQHQDFSGYALSLSESQRNEWIKVKGRFKEIGFNVPAEQLLLIAADRLDLVKKGKVPAKDVSSLLDIVREAKAFPLTDYFDEKVAKKLYPLELLAGSVMTLALQRYGQNDRSLFTFLDSEDYKGIKQFIVGDSKAPFYNLVEVFDYLLYHYYSIITAQRNPDFRLWKLMQDSIQRAEGLFQDDELIHAIACVKVIGLLQLFSRKSMEIDESFVTRYLILTQGCNVKTALHKLQNFGIVRFRIKENRYILFEGTDVDIEEAIEEARLELSVEHNIRSLNKFFTFPTLLAKKHFLETGTPRYFQFRLSEEPISDIPKGDIDGMINLVFPSISTEESIQLVSSQQVEAILYIYYKNTADIVDQINYLRSIEAARKKYEGDRIAVKEFNALFNYGSHQLRQSVMDNLQSMDSETIAVYFNGVKINDQLSNWKEFNTFLSQVATEIYPHSPVYKNEMVNKNKLSSQISSARSKLLGNIIDQERIEDVGYEKHLFPPDKTIYLSLLKQNGFHQQMGGEWQLTDPTSTSFQAIWQAFLNFLESSKQAKRTLQDFVDEVSVRPFKIKKGLLDFLLPLFLLTKRDSYALYYEGTRFIPQLTGDTIELIIRKPEQYSVKAFHVEGVRLEVFNYYRDLLSQAASTELSKKGFIDTIVPFLTFYKDLPAYAKQTKTITKDSQRLRDAITKATDPEKSFFEDFPQALGYSFIELNDSTDKLEVYFEELRRSIKEIQTSYDALLERFENYIRKDLLGLKDGVTFEEWRTQLQNRFAKAKKDLLPPQMKTFLMRLNSPLEDKNAWLNSIAQAINSKSLDNIQDFEEDILYRKLKEAVEELDNYTDIIKNSSDDDLLDTFKVQLTNIQSGSQSRIVKINQQKLKDVSKRQEKLTKELTDDKNLNIFILARLLEEELKK